MQAAALFALAVAATGEPEPPPWEVWNDLSRLAVLTPGHQVLLRSSHCLSGCRYDRTSAGDTRFLRIEGDEQVVFEETGPGAITRIWMTQGYWGSSPLDPSIRLRVRFDGEAQPRVDLPLPDVFRGDTPPFLAPLVGQRLVSSGGNYSDLPLPFQRGCKVSLVGAEDQRLWFQFTFHRLRDARGVRTFRGDEDLSSLARLLSAEGNDPWGRSAGLRELRTLTLAPGEDASLREYAGPGSLNLIRLHAAPEAWATTDLRLVFDGETRVDMPLADFFGATPGPGVRSTLFGRDADDVLYAYFPMPFFHSAQIRLRNRSPAAPITVTCELRRSPASPDLRSGLFGAVARTSPETPIGVDIPLLELKGQGRWVGLFADLQSLGGPTEYLEGDERVYVDESLHPSLYGTGVEDLFNGGFGFDQGPFRLAWHGAPHREVLPTGAERTSMYRLMVTDAVPFAARLVAGLEGGPTGNLALGARTVGYYYERRDPGLALSAWLDVGDAASRRRAAYAVDGAEVCREQMGSFEGEPERKTRVTVCEREAGSSRFTFRIGTQPGALRLRRRLDATHGEQAADVYLDGRLVGRVPPVEPNPFRLLREIDLDLPPDAVTPAGVLAFRIVPAFAAGERFSEVRWELWAPPLSAQGPAQ